MSNPRPLAENNLSPAPSPLRGEGWGEGRGRCVNAPSDAPLRHRPPTRQVAALPVIPIPSAAGLTPTRQVAALTARIGPALGTALLALATTALACGPWIVNRMLDPDTDARLLRAPVADFSFEVNRLLPPGRPPFPVRPPEDDTMSGDGHRQQTADTDLADLEAVLRDPRMTDVDVPALLHQYRMVRDHLRRHGDRAVRAKALQLPAPELGDVPIPRGLPWEFEQYLRGALHHHAGRTDQAIDEWQRLLARPAAARRHRSTWAAFMIGKTLLPTRPDDALAWFEKTRTLAADGFHDSLGLAASSFGWQARALLDLKRPADALALYLTQWRTGDTTATASALFTCRALLQAPDAQLDRAAADPLLRGVVTACLLSRGGGNVARVVQGELAENAATRWLAAVERALPAAAPLSSPLSPRERAGVRGNHAHAPGHPAPSPPDATAAVDQRDAHLHSPSPGGADAATLSRRERGQDTDPLPGADRLAWLAYQAGDMDAAARWCALARDDAPLALWVRAKLALRAGDLDAAADLLARIVRALPADEAWDEPGYDSTDVDTGFRGDFGRFHPRVMAAGELGVVRLLRGRYDQALDVLLEAGYGEDAAYIAERLLTLDELQRYLDQRGDAAGDLRPALGRALARDGRFTQARPYLSDFALERFDQYVAALARAGDARRHRVERAAAWWEAARLASRGEDFLGLVAEPTWHVEGRDSLHPRTARHRLALPPDALSAPRTDERRRLDDSAPTIARERHYPFIAAEHAWQAALLMPDHDEATARILCLGGSWIKVRDPKAADRFYKALLTRCPHTDLARRAQARKWFPVMTDDPDYLAK